MNARDELRLLRNQLADLESYAERVGSGFPVGGAARFAGRIYNAGSMPVTNGSGKFYAVHPVEVTGVDAENGVANLNTDATLTAMVRIISSGNNPVAGDYVIPRSVDYRWQTWKGGSGGGSFIRITDSKFGPVYRPSPPGDPLTYVGGIHFTLPVWNATNYLIGYDFSIASGMANLRLPNLKFNTAGIPDSSGTLVRSVRLAPIPYDGSGTVVFDTFPQLSEQGDLAGQVVWNPFGGFSWGGLTITVTGIT